MRSCEKYCVSSNKWSGIAPLRKVRYSSASCLFQNKEVFCFNGLNDKDNNINSIEYLGLDRDAKWRRLPEIKKLRDKTIFAAIPSKEGILIFSKLFGHYTVDTLREDEREVERHSDLSYIMLPITEVWPCFWKGELFAVGVSSMN